MSASRRRVLAAALPAALALALACSGGGSAPPAPAPPAAATSAPATSPLAASAPTAASPVSTAPPQSGGLQKVRYGELNLLSDAGIYVGMDEGYYAEQGIEIDTSPFDSAANMVAPLATNQLEVGGGATSAGLFNALRTGVNVRIVADKGHSDPTPPGFPVSIYLLRKDLADSRVKSVADLKGMRSAKPAQGISPELDLTAFLKQGGLTPGDLDMSIMSFPDMIPAFANRNLDFAWSVEPFATIALNQGNVVKMGYDYQVNPSNQVAVLLYSPEFSRSDLGTKFMVAYLRAIRVYNDAFLKREPAAREKVIDSLTRHTPVKDRALYDQMELSALDPDGKMDLHSFDEQQDFFLATGSQQARVDLSQFIDLQHIESAAAQLGPYR
ncbi:MAG TPA: ABC transporter substrate-binding protein [Chloroflexota bacterium]|nr:ABC transporter substrate-binding protein [Chloroflexota bacterium]